MINPKKVKGESMQYIGGIEKNEEVKIYDAVIPNNVAARNSDTAEEMIKKLECVD